MMTAFFLSTNPETQNLEDCLPNSLFIFQAYLLKMDKKHQNQQFGSPSALSITTEKRIYTLKTHETKTPPSEMLPLPGELSSLEHSKKLVNDEKYYETEKGRRYEDDGDDKLLKH